MQKALRGAGAAALATLALFAFTPLANRLHAKLAAPPPFAAADAIVVLGAGVGPDAVLSDPSLRRALHGILLFRGGLAPRILFLGPRTYPGRVVEAEVRARLALELGVPAAAILTEARGRTTHDEAGLSASLLHPRGARRILLVTGFYHMPRAQPLFERAGFEVVPAPANEVSGGEGRPAARLDLARRLAQEIVARMYYRLAGYL